MCTHVDIDTPAPAGAQLLPDLLPKPWPHTDAGRRIWKIGPGDSHVWTVLGDPPMPTDQKAGGSSPSERATVFPGHRVDLPLAAVPLPSSGRILAGSASSAALARRQRRSALEGPRAHAGPTTFRSPDRRNSNVTAAWCTPSSSSLPIVQLAATASRVLPVVASLRFTVGRPLTRRPLTRISRR